MKDGQQIQIKNVTQLQEILLLLVQNNVMTIIQLCINGFNLSQYQCQKSCIQCKFGQCKKCENGYQNLDGKCFEITYDGLTTENEQ
ncbi:unnamed protein product [Paramecium primaurelia]|uniref:Uncharacterized protein n=1 Tax=Paramecium primaurelia TaxID=5886 RepID=A0A8S1JY19_PARPR|nr:unnamed protein product [Paramecium primaurelia]CAD8045596.1 unnamed protein product [Paramecium primaurelia]